METADIKLTNREITRGQATKTLSARDLWTFLESKQPFHDWLFSRLDKYKLVADEDYVIEKATRQVPTANGMESKVVVEYHLTIEAAKSLSMVQDNEKGRQVRKYFIECERIAKEAHAASSKPTEPPIDPMKVLADPAKLRSILLTYAEELLTAKETINQQAPKVQALARIAECSRGSFCITDAAKALQIDPNSLFKWLHSHDWIYRRAGSRWLAYQTRVKQGFLEVKMRTVKCRDLEGMTYEMISDQVRITGKGMAYLGEVFSRSPANSESTTTLSPQAGGQIA